MILNHIFTDNRGSIHALTEGLHQFPEIAILQTNAGLARGGCIHDKSTEYLCVLEGEIIYVYGGDIFNARLPHSTFDVNPQGHAMVRMKVGDTIAIQKNTPHYFISVTNSTVAEWGADPSEKQAKHEEFRAIVTEYNKGK